NNLQIIVGMVDMSLRGGKKTVAASKLKRIASGIKALSAVHDLLTQQAKADGQANWISAGALIRKLLGLIQITAPGVRVVADIAEGQISTKKGASLALVMNELVSNAMKHGATRVEVVYAVDNGGAALRVSDDGPGFPAAFDPAKGSNTGLELALNLSRWDLGGELLFENRSDGGACVTLTIP
ncbi:MAG TPA: sensor histidine kinase, partial [Chthonomonadales bacterium]|nr:sensor histidine kinase [Chthonomonadales bacterium]